MANTFNFGDLFSARSVIGTTVLELGEKYGNFWVVTPDIGAALGGFKKSFPDRFVDVGIAEQNSIGVAAGLALEGNYCLVMGMIPFLTMRACEQVRTAVCYQNLNVRIIGTGGGLTSGGGSTHNAMEDIAIMKSLVNMTVLSIGDPLMIRDILHLSMRHEGPMFIRLAQGKADRILYEEGTRKFEIGKGLVTREGKDLTIFSHGELVSEAWDAAEILAKDGIDVRVIDMFTIKPLDGGIIKQAVEETRNIIVLEDHLMYGGLASSIADYLVDNKIEPKTFKRLGIPQVYAGFGSGPEQRKKYGYDTDAVVAQVRKQL